MISNLKVYVADDHALFAEMLAQVVETFPEVGVVKQCNNGKQLIKMVKEDPPDVVLVDFEMPVMNGMEAGQYIIKHFEDVKIILLTMYDSPSLIFHAMGLGFHAFLVKGTNTEEVHEAIISVMDNDFYYNEITVSALRMGVVEKSIDPNHLKTSNISDREREILILICEELTMKEIGSKLFLSDKTVQNHRQNMLRKLKVKNTAGLVKKAIQLGIYKY
ncbi:MAG: response regulator transcription factor [Cyclobacteriaceae bacterium]|nr:response regulator transcription factor [Cyclobacteriaceae bacterium]